MKITITEFARLAGVSVATVSRVLNKSDKVAAETREKIEYLIKHYNFKPNLLGRNLRTKKTGMIMVLITSISNSFYSKVISSMDKTARQNGYNIVVCITNDNPDTEQSYLNLLCNGLCDGAIIMNTCMNKDDMHNFLCSCNAIQCCEHTDNESPYIAIDNRQAAYDAVNYLIKCGRRKIAYLGTVNQFVSTRMRYEGYCQALNDNGIDYNDKIILYGNYGYRNALEQTEKLLATGEGFDGFFAISDNMAAGVMKAILASGRKIPEDVAVVGFDNVHLSYMVTPALTTVAMSQKEMGEEAVLSLLCKIDGKEPETKILKHELIIRDSTPKI